MQVNKKNINVFLALWIKSDPELWGELRDIEIKILLDRIVKEYSFKLLAEIHKVREQTLRRVFDLIIKKIDLSLGSEVASHLKQLNSLIEHGDKTSQPFDIQRIYLN